MRRAGMPRVSPWFLDLGTNLISGDMVLPASMVVQPITPEICGAGNSVAVQLCKRSL
jgi:hypothetical protein